MDGRIVEQSKMRKAIARRMSESKQQSPHFYVQTEMSADGVLNRLQALNARRRTHITVTVALVRAAVEALRQNPKLNSIWTSEGLLEASSINVGIAIALDEGIVAPALLGAGDLTSDETAVALRDLVERARSARLRPAEMTEGTFTLSNLGMFDVTAFTAIITPPQIAVLALGRPTERWALANGDPARHSVMTATLSADHRALDGVDVARFLDTFKRSFEDAESLLADVEFEEAKT